MDFNINNFIDNAKDVLGDPASAYTGAEIATVIKISPLMLDCNGVEITSEFLFLTPLCEAFTTESLKHNHSHSHSCPDGSTSVDATDALSSVTVWRGLQSGDKVLVVRTNKSQKYVVLCRLGKL